MRPQSFLARIVLAETQLNALHPVRLSIHNLPGQVRAHLLVAVRGGRKGQVVDGQRLEAERGVQSGSVEPSAKARLERVYPAALARLQGSVFCAPLLVVVALHIDWFRRVKSISAGL